MVAKAGILRHRLDCCCTHRFLNGNSIGKETLGAVGSIFVYHDNSFIYLFIFKLEPV